MTAGDLPPGYPFSFAEAVTARQRTKPGQPVDTIREQFQPRFFFSLISFGPRQFGRTPKNAFYTSSERARTHTGDPSAKLRRSTSIEDKARTRNKSKQKQENEADHRFVYFPTQRKASYRTTCHFRIICAKRRKQKE